MGDQVHGPRSVIASSRRVCLPSRLIGVWGWEKGDCLVFLGLSPSREGELVIRRAVEPGEPMGVRDPDRPRFVDVRGHVTIPASLMDQVGVSKSEPWVYFAADPDEQALRVIPERILQFDVMGAA